MYSKQWGRAFLNVLAFATKGRREVRIFRLVQFAVVGVAIGFSCTAPAADCDVCPKDAALNPGAREIAEARAQIDELIMAYGEHLTTGNVDGILELYSADPVFMPEFASPAVGRVAVRSAYESVVAALRLNGRFTVHEMEIAGDWAWVRTSASGRVTVVTTGVESDIASSELFVLKREDGAWRIHRYIFNTAAPPAQ